MKHLDRLLKVLSLVVFMLILSSMTALAQTTIKGNVSDESGEPLIGAVGSRWSKPFLSCF